MVIGREQSFAGSLLLPPATLEDVSLAADVGDALSALAPWQDALIGDALARALRGESRVGLVGGLPCLAP